MLDAPTPDLDPTAPSPSAPALVDLSVVIVNYNVAEFLEQALRSVDEASRGLDVEVFVVDNNSADGSAELVRRHFPHVHLIANEANVGFSKANNQALRRAQGRYLLVLNPDTIVREDTLHTLVRFMEGHPEAGAVGCQILNPDGTFAPESRRAFPTPSVALYRLLGLGRVFPRSPRFGRYNLTYLPRDQVAEVDALSGSCMLVRRAAVLGEEEAAGLLDEGFFMYGEDLDWCYRIQQAGWKIYYTPETQIIHYKGESTKKGELRYVRLFYGAMLRFSEKHFHGHYSRLFTLLLRIGIVGRAGLTVLTSGARRAAGPALDFALAYGLVLLVGALYASGQGASLAPLFAGTVAPAYALGVVLGVALADGYSARGRSRLRPVLLGAFAGLLLVAALSFFVKTIAFSRAIVLLSFPAVVVGLGLGRLRRRARSAGPRRAVLVGRAPEAERLRALLAGHPRPPFRLVGYVESEGLETEGPPTVERLGYLRHLRDLVRLGHIDDVVFAGADLTNSTIFGQIRQLQGLGLHFRMFAEGRHHVIGKATVDDLSLPELVPLDGSLRAGRHPMHRPFEVAAALVLLAAAPLARLLAREGGFWARLHAATPALPDVLRGRRALVGHHPADAPPPDWGLRPGVFSPADALLRDGAEARRRAYAFYAQHASPALDAALVWRTLRASPPAPPS